MQSSKAHGTVSKVSSCGNCAARLERPTSDFSIVPLLSLSHLLKASSSSSSVNRVMSKKSCVRYDVQAWCKPRFCRWCLPEHWPEMRSEHPKLLNRRRPYFEVQMG